MPSPAAKRILLINPNTSTTTTERLLQVLTPRLPPDVLLDGRTAQFGARYIACEASHAVAAHAMLEIWAEQVSAPSAPPTGVLIGCFGDPGLFALRESSACPVTGLAEASFIEASSYGDFAIVTGGERWRPMLHRLAQALGYGEQLRHIETVAPSGAELLADPEMANRCLTQACTNAVRTGVKAIIIGGAGLAGYAEKLQTHQPIPLIDSAQAGLNILLSDKAPSPLAKENGFHAQWSNVRLSTHRH
jgi:allantoin racemase